MWRRRPEITVAAALFAISLALTANLLFSIGTIKAERLLCSVGRRLSRRRIALGTVGGRACLLRSVGLAVAAIFAVLVARTWVRNDDWRDERTLYALPLCSRGAGQR